MSEDKNTKAIAAFLGQKVEELQALLPPPNEFLVKAKRLDSGQWVKGCLVNNLWVLSATQTPTHQIISTESDEYYDCWEDIQEGNFIHDVDPKTICRLSPLLDDNNRPVWQGDILRVYSMPDWHSKFDYKTTVFYGRLDLGQINWQQTYGWGCIRRANNEIGDRGILSEFHQHDGIRTEVVGNIFDNAELIQTP